MAKKVTANRKDESRKSRKKSINICQKKETVKGKERNCKGRKSEKEKFNH